MPSACRAASYDRDDALPFAAPLCLIGRSRVGSFVAEDNSSIGRDVITPERAMHAVLPVGPASQREQADNKNNDDDYNDVTLHESDTPVSRLDSLYDLRLIR